MRYDMKKTIVGRFVVYESNPKTWMVHKKRFIQEGVTPMSQTTFNIYTLGKFLFKVEELGFSQVLSTGDTSLSLDIDRFPLGKICTEQAITEDARRLCVSASSGTWTRGVFDLANGENIDFLPGACVVVLSGLLTYTNNNIPTNAVFSPIGTMTAIGSTKIAFAQ